MIHFLATLFTAVSGVSAGVALVPRDATVAAAFQAGDGSPGLLVNNWCGVDVYLYASNNGGCNTGPNGACYNDPNGAPLTIPAGHMGQPINWIKNGQGTSFKFAKDKSFATVLQFECDVQATVLYWDLSNLDGGGAGITGTPFAGDNVKVTPSGDGVGVGSCTPIKCTANQTCVDAYQKPDDTDTKGCPATTGTITLDLCMPEDKFNA